MADMVNTALKGHRVTKTYETEDGTKREYKDISYSFFANPMNGDVGKSIGPTAIKNSILSIIKTNHNERLFDPEFGTGLNALLFEQMNPITAERIRTAIQNAVAAHEPRANILKITVVPQEEQNRYKVGIIFDLSTEVEAQAIEILMERA